VSVNVNLVGNQISVIARGMDFYVDWPENPGSGDVLPGLAILDKLESDATGQTIAYFPPGQWLGVYIDAPTTG
jgi:hypothetical protein